MCLDRLSDSELIDQTRQGRREAFSALVTRHQNRLFGGMVKMLGSAERAQDAVQEAFFLAYQRIETFQGNAAFSTWLFRIAVNAALSQKRRERRGAMSLEQQSSAGAEPIDNRPGADPSQPIEQRETQETVRAALAALPEDFRIVLVLKEIEGFCYEEISETVGIPLGTVRSRIHRARNELRQKLQMAMKQSP